MLTLVLGGARSGKSSHAQSLLRGRETVFFIATADAGDDEEMGARIRRHRAVRPEHFETLEAPLELVPALARLEPSSAVLVDCVTLWLSNLLYHHRELDREMREARILDEVDGLIEASRTREVVLVSNEVGEGIVPESSVAREFRDIQGRANQKLAAAATRVVLMVAGIPVAVK